MSEEEIAAIEIVATEVGDLVTQEVSWGEEQHRCKLL